MKKKNRTKTPKNYYLHNSIKIFLQRKVFNYDVMLISQVAVVYNALNEFVDSDKIHSNNYSFCHVWRNKRMWFSLANFSDRPSVRTTGIPIYNIKVVVTSLTPPNPWYHGIIIYANPFVAVQSTWKKGFQRQFHYDWFWLQWIRNGGAHQRGMSKAFGKVVW